MKEMLLEISNWFALVICVLLGLIVGGVTLRFLWNCFKFGWNLLG
jgi:hypothetical protein